MEQGKQGVMVGKLMPQQNPMEQIQARYKELEGGFRAWLAKQSLPVEAAVVTITSAAQGAAIGAFMGTLTNDTSSAIPTPPPQAANLNPQAMASFKQAQVFFFFFTLLHSIHFLILLEKIKLWGFVD
jgi:hypothetical protein